MGAWWQKICHREVRICHQAICHQDKLVANNGVSYHWVAFYHLSLKNPYLPRHFNFGHPSIILLPKVKVLVYSPVLALAAIHMTLQASHYLPVRELHQTFDEFQSVAHFAHL